MLVLYAIRRMLNKILRYYFSYITILFLPINIKTFQDTIYYNDFFFNGFFLWFFLIYIFSVCFLQNYSGLMTRIMKASSLRLILVFCFVIFLTTIFFFQFHLLILVDWESFGLYLDPSSQPDHIKLLK